jgi:sec-independent protein translocase protein TatA
MIPSFDIPPTVATTLALWGIPAGAEIIVILFVGLLLFGRRLPEVGRSLGQGIVEFKKGLKGVTDEIDQAATTDQRSPQRIGDQSATDASRRVDAPQQQVSPQRTDGH